MLRLWICVGALVDHPASQRLPSANVQRALWGIATTALLWVVASGGGVASAQPRPDTTTAPAPATDQTATRPSDAPLPSCLDHGIKDELQSALAPRGVQERNFRKAKRFELAARGGIFAGDMVSSSWIAGGALTFFATEDFGIEASFDVTHIGLDLDKPLTSFFGNSNFEDGSGYVALGNFVWSPIHAKLKIGDSIVHSDFLLYGGAGRLIHSSTQGIAYDAGFALDMFVSKYVTFRFDARDLMTIQEAVAETRFTNNFIATAGIAVWIPSGFSP